jgi:hypothetical protein
MAVATLTCPRCGTVNEWPECPNCGGLSFRRGGLADGSVGLICKDCNLGRSHVACSSGCGTWLPAENFGTTTSRIAGQISRNLQSNQGGGCFISTELYGLESEEVRLLRRFRDCKLLGNLAGRRFVHLYYRWAPAAIPMMRRFQLVRWSIHGAVATIVFLVRWRYGAALCRDYPRY